MNRITRVEVIDEEGRSYVNWEDDNNVSWQFQDDGRTLKVFVNKVKSKTGEEEALESLDKFQNDWLLGKKCPETKLEIKNLNSVESIKAEIKVLQSKLEFYEELEKTKSPAEEAYKEVYGWHPPTTSSVSNYEDNRWRAFQNGYNASKVSETPQEPEELKTLYDALQCPLYINGYHFTEDQKDWICDIVKEWMSQYADNVMCGEYLKGYEECLTVLEENLK